MVFSHSFLFIFAHRFDFSSNPLRSFNLCAVFIGRLREIVPTHQLHIQEHEGHEAEK